MALAAWHSHALRFVGRVLDMAPPADGYVVSITTATAADKPAATSFLFPCGTGRWTARQGLLRVQANLNRPLWRHFRVTHPQLPDPGRWPLQGTQPVLVLGPGGLYLRVGDAVLDGPGLTATLCAVAVDDVYFVGHPTKTTPVAKKARTVRR